MLVLSRKVGERVVVGGDIVVTVLEVRGRQVRLGIEAPDQVPIWRGEIHFDSALAPASSMAEVDQPYLRNRPEMASS